MELHHETKARLTQPNGMPIDYVPNNHRSAGFNQQGNCMSPQYSRAGTRTYGVAPELWNVDPTPSLAIIKADGSRTVIPHKEFRTGQRKIVREAKVDNASQYDRMVRLVGVDLSLASE
jgi:hypothetical protein